MATSVRPPETKLETWWRTRPEWLIQGFVILGPTGLSIASLIPNVMDGKPVPWQLKGSIIFFSLILTIVGITMLSGAKRRESTLLNDEQDRHEAELTAEKRKHDKELAEVRDELAQHYLDQEVEVVRLLSELHTSSRCVLQASDNLRTRMQREGLKLARGQILMQVRHMLGKNKEGVRANLFEVQEGSRVIGPASIGNAGSAGIPSTRTFYPESETYKSALAGRALLVRDTSEIQDEDLSYGCFLAAPVVTGQKLLGILAVDSPDPGDLVDYDVHLLMQFASLIAITDMLGPDTPPCVPLGTADGNE